MRDVEEAVLRRLGEVSKTARMWGSPEELESVTAHFTHVLFSLRTPGWTYAQTLEAWATAGGPFAADPQEHAAMRDQLWGREEDRARAQVVQGFVVVWAGLERRPEREALVGEWVEALLDAPELPGPPDRLNMALFALMGFVAADPQRYVQALNFERHRVGGHELRPLTAVGPRGPTEAGLTYTRNFTSWARVLEGLRRVLERAESP